MQHEIRAIEKLAFVTKLSSVTPHKDKEEGFRATLSCYFGRGYDSVTVTTVDKGKSKQFNCRGSAQCCSSAYRSCENGATRAGQKLLQSKRSRTHDTTDKDYEECDKKSLDDMDLTDHCREDTHCVSRGFLLDVSGCLRSKLTVWKEDQFTV